AAAPVVLSLPSGGSENSSANFGTAVHFVPDFIGDQQDEIFIGAPGYFFGDGGIFLFTDEASAPTLSLSGSGSGEALGRAVTSIPGLAPSGRPALAATFQTGMEGAIRLFDPSDGQVFGEIIPDFP